MRILILNWKDIKHPDSGGAETVTHKLAKHLVAFGHSITWFTAQPGVLKPQETIEGIKIVRQGNRATVYLHAFFFYQKCKNDFDLVVDQIHGIPFFTPLFVKKPILAYIHEVANEIWFIEWPFFIGLIGKCIEKIYFVLYRTIPFLTHSRSTRKELVRHGISSSNIRVISPTIDKPLVKKQSKSPKPLLVYIGRLSPLKQTKLLIEATYILRQSIPNLLVVIAGSGKPDYVKRLKYIIKNLLLVKHIKLVGPVTEPQKYQLLSQGWLHIQPSHKEGFGLTVIEAAVVGTPTICFNIPGLKDQIKSRVNGMIVEKETPEALADTILKLLYNPRHLQKLSQSTRAWSKTFPSWEKQTKKLEKLLSALRDGP